jgi:hypothetical protein
MLGARAGLGGRRRKSTTATQAGRAPEGTLTEAAASERMLQLVREHGAARW